MINKNYSLSTLSKWNYFSSKSNITNLLLVLSLIIIDQLSKYYVFRFLDSKNINSWEVNKIFNLTKVWNSGISFGILNGFKYSNILFLLITLIIVLSIIYYITTKEINKYLRLGYLLIIGGAIGNVIDRIRFKAVADFLDFHLGDYYWPVFNLADAFVCIGVFIIIVQDFIIEKQ